MHKRRSTRLALHSETVRALTSNEVAMARGGARNTFYPLSCTIVITVTYSIDYCTSRNTCGTLLDDCNA